MNHHYSNCSFCDGTVEEKRVNVDYRVKTGLVIIENVPAGVCQQCGERYYTAQVAKTMEIIANNEQPFLKVVSVPVREFPENITI